jgi:predicted enzyme related to lactoylglutathione lyase
VNQGITTVIYPVKDLVRAKKLFSELLASEPYADMPYYVGYKLGDQEIGLDPNGFYQGMTGPVGYYTVDDIRSSLQLIIDAGGKVLQQVRDVGGGKQIATVQDTEGNAIGLIQMP